MLFWLYVFAGVLVLLAALLTLVRLTLGPTILDRAVAVDVLTVVALAGGGLATVYSPREETMVFLVLLALTGFFSAVIVSRFVAVRDSHEGVKLSDSVVEGELQ